MEFLLHIGQGSFNPGSRGKFKILDINYPAFPSELKFNIPGIDRIQVMDGIQDIDQVTVLYRFKGNIGIGCGNTCLPITDDLGIQVCLVGKQKQYSH